MKTIITLLATTAFVAGASAAMAVDFQAGEDAVNYELSHRAVGGWSGAYNSVRTPGEVHNSTFDIPRPMIDFQAGGSN